MDKVLPIGSVFELDGFKCLVVGYKILENKKKNTIKGCYIVASYPVGFSSLNDLNIVPHDKVQNVLFEGYESELAKGYLHNKKILFDESDNITYSEAKEALRLLQEEIDRQGDEKEYE